MKRGLMFLVLFFTIVVNHTFATETCQYIEHEGHIEFLRKIDIPIEHLPKTIEYIVNYDKKNTLMVNGIPLGNGEHEILSYGYSESENEIALISKDENGNVTIETYKRVGNTWEKYQLLDYNPKPEDIYYANYYPYYSGGDRHLSIFIKNDNGSIKKIFTGYHGFNSKLYIYAYIYNGISLDVPVLFIDSTALGYYDETIGFSIYEVHPGKLDENHMYGLLSIKEKGYARYLDRTYSYTEFGKVLPKYYAYRATSESGKYYIQFNGEKGKEYDTISRNINYWDYYTQFIGDDRFVYYAEDNDKKYTIEIICE